MFLLNRVLALRVLTGSLFCQEDISKPGKCHLKVVDRPPGASGDRSPRSAACSCRLLKVCVFSFRHGVLAGSVAAIVVAALLVTTSVLLVTHEYKRLACAWLTAYGAMHVMAYALNAF